ncbi:MAG: tetratricopeptide repeat protein [Chitinophagaceae bacterium]
MKKSVFTIVAIALIACNNEQKKDPKTGVSIPNHIESLAKSVEAKPDSVGLRFNLINAYDSIGAYKLAQDQLDSLIQFDKGNYALWFKKAQVFEHAGDTAKAIKHYQQAAKIYVSPECLLALANLYAETKNKEVFTICDQINAMRLGRSYDGYTAFFMGVFYARTGNFNQAVNFFDQSIVSNYVFMDAYMEKGYLLFDTKKWNEALAIFKKVTAINNLYVDGYYWQAKCYEALKQKKQAIDQYQNALNLDKNLIEAEEAIKRLTQ